MKSLCNWVIVGIFTARKSSLEYYDKPNICGIQKIDFPKTVPDNIRERVF